MTYCEECLHYEVCCDEGKDDEACIYCKNRIVPNIGLWIEKDGNWYCSKCGCLAEEWLEKPTYKYCSECGAKMFDYWVVYTDIHSNVTKVRKLKKDENPCCIETEFLDNSVSITVVLACSEEEAIRKVLDTEDKE